MCVGETLRVPLRTYEHPNGVLIPDPTGSGYVTILFVSHAQPTASRLTTTQGWYRTLRGPVTLRLMRAYVYVCALRVYVCALRVYVCALRLILAIYN